MANHSETEKKPIYKKVWFWILIIIVIAIIGTSMSGTSKNTIPTSGQETTLGKETTKEEEILEVDYNVLYQDYQDNAIAADAKYKGKTLKLTGKVGSIDREIAGNTYITFDIEFLKNIRITFKKSEESKVAQLTKSQTVTIKGKCTGTLLSTTVALNDCEIVE